MVERKKKLPRKKKRVTHFVTNNPRPKGKMFTKVITEEEDPSKWIGRRKRPIDDKQTTYRKKARVNRISPKEDTLLLKKGSISPKERLYGDEGLAIYCWDKLLPCSSQCKIFNNCELQEQAQEMGEPKCLVMREYLQVALNVLLKYNDKNLDEALSYRIGVHLIPLYRMLFRLKIEELSIRDVITRTKQGIKIHPVFKEIRETIRGIETFWKEHRLRGPMFPNADNLGAKPGDGSYYEKLEDGELETPRRVIKVPKREVNNG